MNPILIKDIIELGIMAMISGVFIRQQQKLFEQQTETVKTLVKLERNLNSNNLRGKGLELALTFKAHDIRWSIQKKLIWYIERNHIKENWIVIPGEIETFFNIKLNEFEDDVHDIVDNFVYKMVFNLFKYKLEEMKKISIEILEELKNEDVTSDDYKQQKRNIEAHMVRIEAELIKEIKNLLG